MFKTSANAGKGFSYHQFVDAQNETEFNDFVTNCKNLSFYDTGITPVYGDKLLCLSTCEYTIDNGRFVVAAVAVQNVDGVDGVELVLLGVSAVSLLAARIMLSKPAAWIYCSKVSLPLPV